jgi:SAM-dependent methyltransferase
VFVDSPEYWGEAGISRERAQEVAQRMALGNWRAVVANHESAEVRQYFRFVSNLDRVGWHEMLSLPPSSRVLDIGAGLGTMSYAISHFYDEVFSVERVRERVDFMRIRFRQDQAENITLLRTDIDTLPFQERSFDLIILNGVLEWLPFSRKDLKPHDAQLHYLRLARRYLKPGGILYIGIENRSSYSQLIGAPDPHTGWRFTSVLPRAVSDIISRIKTGDRYRPYLYSHAGYRKLLRQAGFASSDTFAAIPSYTDPKVLLSLDRPSEDFETYVWQSNHWLSRLIKGAMTKLDLLKYFGYAYIMFAHNGPAERSDDRLP